MPRPKTQSEPVNYRLPLDVYAELEARAAAADESVHTYSRRAWIALLSPATVDPSTCDHPSRSRDKIGSGLVVCKKCRQARGLDGVWRNVA